MNEHEPVSKEVVEEEVKPWQNMADEFSGEFDIQASNHFRDILAPPSGEQPDRQDFFGMAAAAAFAQGHYELAQRLITESKKPLQGILMGGSYPDVVTSNYSKQFHPGKPNGPDWRDEGDKWVRYASDEQEARQELAQSLAIALESVSRNHGGKGETMIDVSIKDGIQKEIFLYLTKLLVKDPTNISAAKVEIEWERFEKRIAPSVIAGYNFEQWRHNRHKLEFGHDDDMVKLSLTKAKPE